MNKSLSEAWERVRQEFRVKLACLGNTQSGFKISSYLESKARAILDSPEVKNRVNRTVEDTSGAEQHPVLYNRLRKWRDAVARESGIPAYMVLPVKTMATLTSVLPHTTEELRTIKGLGKQKIEKYGDMILSVIADYCSQHKIVQQPYVSKNGAPVKKERDKRPTREITMDLYRKGKSPREIAEIRDMSIQTIEGHLAEYIATGEIAISELVPLDRAEFIAGYFPEGLKFQLGPVKAALGDQASWTEVRYVARYVEYLRQLSS